MRIIIVGGGVVGSALAEHLLKDGHSLAMVELDAGLSTHLTEKHDLQILTGSGSSPELLYEAGIADADMILAVTPNDETNMIVCAVAAQYGVKQRIARLRGREFTRKDAKFDLGRIGVTDLIHPEQVMVNNIMQFIETPHAVETANFEDGQILLRGYRAHPEMELAGRTPREIREMIAPHIILFAAVDREGEGMIPDGDFRIEPGDIVYALFPRESLDSFMRLIGQEKKKNRKIIVTGDSYALMEMVKGLESTESKVVVVHRDLQGAKILAGRFDNVEVLHGDCTDAELLREIHVETASFLISMSDQPDYNIMSALLAKAEGAHEVIATITEDRHHTLFTSIGVDHVVNQRLVVAREILEIISRGRISAAVELSDIDIDAVRFNVETGSQIAGLQIKEIARKLKRGSIIGVIVRDNRMILPGGESVVEAGDHVIIITRTGQLERIARLFR